MVPLETPVKPQLNQDLHVIEQPKPSSNKKTVIVRHKEAIGGGGFFETQVEVVEKLIEIEVDNDELNDK